MLRLHLEVRPFSGTLDDIVIHPCLTSDSPNILGMLTDALSTLNLQGDASSVNTPSKISSKILASTLKATKTAKSRPPVDCDSDIEEIIFAVKRVGICE